MKNFISIFICLFLFLNLINCRPFWGYDGHKIVAQIAWEQLSLETQIKVQKYLGNQSLWEVATEPDSYCHSTEGEWSAAQHYVDLPDNATHFDPYYCRPTEVGCVVWAINNYTIQLLNNNTNPQYPVEPSPLTFLVHYVGDCHQPLHVYFIIFNNINIFLK
eukprot:TRINITY_DN7_c0_g3_i2.p1 TRINITY_DN7_c0_g3~~TRINITY_DN7_c0_g3_i2.p1  ORF type:complete len:161 (-),score=55.05 TRINITY_DN7_c0_g3_i2:50-532(-)